MTSHYLVGPADGNIIPSSALFISEEVFQWDDIILNYRELGSLCLLFLSDGVSLATLQSVQTILQTNRIAINITFKTLGCRSSDLGTSWLIDVRRTHRTVMKPRINIKDPKDERNGIFNFSCQPRLDYFSMDMLIEPIFL